VNKKKYLHTKQKPKKQQKTKKQKNKTKQTKQNKQNKTNEGKSAMRKESSEWLCVLPFSLAHTASFLSNSVRQRSRRSCPQTNSQTTYHPFFWFLCVCTKTVPLGGYWKHVQNVRHFLDEIGSRELGIKEVKALSVFLFLFLSFHTTTQFSDWYSISRKQLLRAGGRGLLAEYGSPAGAVMAAYPEYPWQPSNFSHSSPNRANLLASLKAVENGLGIKDVRKTFVNGAFDLGIFFLATILNTNK
jgi:hypothetical protein